MDLLPCDVTNRTHQVLISHILDKNPVKLAPYLDSTIEVLAIFVMKLYEISIYNIHLDISEPHFWL